MLKKYIWVNGKVVPANKPVLLINDIGFLRGYGVFDFMRTYNGKIFRYRDHYKRFVNSARLLDLKVGLKEKELEQIIYKLIKKNGLRDASIRLVLSGGPAIEGIFFNPAKPTFAILIEDIYTLPAELYQTGAKLMTFDYERLIPEAKNLNYIWAVKLQKEKLKRGAIEILYTSKGEILECSTSNFFLVKKGELITPKDGILSGITRKTVFDLAKKLKIKVKERPIKLSELKMADEAFISATNKSILPIVKIDSQKIGAGVPGPITKALLAKFEKLTENY
jgi:branched-chain amino acid aminotransferase